MLLSNGNISGIPYAAIAEPIPIVTEGYFYAKDGLLLERQFATYAALYKAQPWVSTVVDKVSSAVARLPLEVWDYSGEGRTLDTTSKYAKLMQQPNAKMSTFDFWVWVTSTFEIYGEAFLYKLRDDNLNVIQLLPMHPSRVFVKRNPVTGRLTYVFTAGTASAGLLTADEDDVIPFKRYNPDGLMRGHSRLEPLRSTLMNEDSMRRADAAWWRNMGRPSIVVTSEKPLKDLGMSRLRDSIAQHQGSDNTGKPLILQDGVTAQAVQLTAEEMSYIESRKLNRGEVCSVYDIPPPVVHILDNATFSNITEQMRSMYRDTMAPRIMQLESILDTFLRSEFGARGVSKRAVFAVDEILRGDIETRATTAVALTTNGIAKPDEMRPWFGMSQVGGVADKLYANSAMLELGTKPPAPATSSANDPEDNTSEDDNADDDGMPPKRNEGDTDSNKPPAITNPPNPTNKHYRSIMGKIGRGQSLKDIRASLLEDSSVYELDELSEIVKALAMAEGKINEHNH